MVASLELPANHNPNRRKAHADIPPRWCTGWCASRKLEPLAIEELQYLPRDGRAELNYDGTVNANLFGLELGSAGACRNSGPTGARWLVVRALQGLCILASWTPSSPDLETAPPMPIGDLLGPNYPRSISAIPLIPPAWNGSTAANSQGTLITNYTGPFRFCFPRPDRAAAYVCAYVRMCGFLVSNRWKANNHHLARASRIQMAPLEH